MKRWISLLLALIMVLSIPLSAVSAEEPQGTQTADEVLSSTVFEDRFETGSEYDQTKWMKAAATGATMTISEQKLKIGTTTIPTDQCAIASVKDMQLADAIYEYDVSNIGGSWCSLLFNRTDMTHRWDDSGYFLPVKPDGTCQLLTYFNKTYVTLGEAKIAGYNNSVGASMKVVVYDGKITVYANGSKLFEVAAKAGVPSAGYAAFTTTGRVSTEDLQSYASIDNVTIKTAPVSECTVTFDAKGGTCEPASSKVNSGGKLASLPTPKKGEETFNGWFVDDGTFKVPFTTDTVVFKSMTVYASFTAPPVQCTVTFDAKDGACATASAVVIEGNKLAELPTATKDGALFMGWFTDDGKWEAPFTTGTVVTANMTVYARFQTADTANLARQFGCTYSASSYYSDPYVPDKAFDGGLTDNLSRWAADNRKPNTEHKLPQWIQVDFPKATTFNKINIYDHTTTNIQGWKLEYKAAADSPWVQFEQGGALVKNKAQTMWFDPITAVSMRMTITAGTPGMSIFEIELYHAQMPTDNDADAATLVTLPIKLEYELGEAFDGTGGQLRVVYVDGSSRLVPLDEKNPAIVVRGYDKNKHGEQELTVEYAGRGVTFFVTVSDPAAVKKVVADNPGGTYNTPTVNVALSCATEGSEIYYTTDGSVPTKASTRYSEPIVIKRATTLKVVAIKEGMTDSIVSTHHYVVGRIEQHGEVPFVLRPTDAIDNLECLTAGSAARNKEVTMFTAGPVKYFWTNNFGARPGTDYLAWDVKSDLQEKTDYFAYLMTNANKGTSYKITVSQGNASEEFSFTKQNSGFEVADFGTIKIPAGVSTITLTSSATNEFKSLNLIRSSDKAAYDKRIADYRASGNETLERFKNQEYGLFYQFGHWGYPSIGPQKGDTEARANRFNVDEFIDIQKKLGAEYLVWSISWWTYRPWQNVDAINQAIGHNEWTTERDVATEVAAACKEAGIDFYLYYHTGLQEDAAWSAANNWPKDTNLYGAGDKSKFMDTWCAVISEFGTELGENLDGWFFDDGCNYFPADFERFAQATKLGNSKRIVAYNAWRGCKVTEFQDMCFGEATWGEEKPGAPTENGINMAGKETGLQQVGMPFIGADWGIHKMNQKTSLKVSASDMIAKVKSAHARHVPIALGVEMYEEGVIHPDIFNALMQLKKAINPDSVEPATTPVSSIEVLAQKYSVAAGNTLQMKGVVKPQYATNKAFTWKVVGENGAATTLATIDENGVLTAGETNGKVQVCAISQENPKIVGVEVVEITGGIVPPDPIPDPIPGHSGNSDKTTTIVKNEDGSTTTTTTDKDGNMRVTTKYPNGTTIDATMPKDGTISAVVTVPQGLEQMTITIPANKKLTPGTVAVIVKSDGTKEIVKSSVATKDGMRIVITGSAVIELLDNTKTFSDVKSNDWFKDAVAFASSRELFGGTSVNEFSPEAPMTRAMLMTVLYRYDGATVKGEGNSWYADAMAWAKQTALSDGSSPNGSVSREQLATMLYRYAKPEAAAKSDMSNFADGSKVSSFASEAMNWAVRCGLLSGKGNNNLDPQGNATRAEVATMLMRFCENRK